MSVMIDAVYQNGVFRPITPPDLSDGTAVRLTVVPATSASADPFDPDEVYARLKAIADLPEEGGGDPTITGRNHDKVLYGGPKGAR